MIDVICDFCGETTQKYPSRVNEDEKNFCGSECYAEWQSENNKGENHHQFEGEIVSCANCGDEKAISPAFVGKSENYFCDPECHGEWYSENAKQENNHNWKGGSPEYYGSDWYESRRAVRERDENTCQMCGDTEEEIGYKPPVHHIRPLRWFENPNNAHYLRNMVQLCQPCHMDVEVVPSHYQLEEIAMKGQMQQGLGAFL